MTTPVVEPIRAITTTGHQSLITAQRPTVDIQDVHFRMLEPREIKRAMDFPESYELVGSRREQVRLAGNAVTPPAARDIVGLVVETLNEGPCTSAASSSSRVGRADSPTPEAPTTPHDPAKPAPGQPCPEFSNRPPAGHTRGPCQSG
jgi:hypothetical protein